MRPAIEVQEPSRTERLLSQPAALIRSNASDSLDAIGFALMARSGGQSLFALLFEYIVLASQVVIAVLSGAGEGLVPGSSAANAQLVTVLGAVRMH